MVVCKFYLEGCCKFGDQCRFEHVDPYQYDHRGSNYERPSGTSVLKSSSTSSDQQLFGQHSFQSSQPQPSRTGGSRFNIHDMMQLVSKDVLLAEKGNQWPLSCYSPIRDLVNIPELLDYSSEELRWECYMAIQNGRLPVCQAIVQQLFANASKVNSKLKKKDTAYEIIEKWLRESEANAQTQQIVPPDGSNNFTNANAAQMFSSSVPQQAPVSSFSFSIPQQEPMGSVQPQQPMPLYVPQQVGFPQQQPLGYQPQPAASSVFGGGQIKAQPPQHDVMDKSAYSLVEELIQSELDAYKADRFVFGHIPTKAPPRELCG